MSEFFTITSGRKGDFGPAVSCPSCKVPAKELFCSTCVTEAIKKESVVHDAQKSSRDQSKKVLGGFLRDNMDSATLAFDTNYLEGENEKMRQLVEQTRLELAKLRDTKKEWQERLEKRKKELSAAKERMAKAKQYDQEIVEPIVHALEQAAANVEESVAGERRRKMEHLLEVFPLVVAEPGFSPVSIIAGVPLGDFQSHPDNPQNSLALALVARVVILAAHYLRIPLPYHLIYERGEAWIEHRGSLVHLQRRLRNLQINIRTLCIAQGVPSNVLARVDFLESLWQLFHSPSLGRPIREAMSEAESRDNKLVLRRAETTGSSGSQSLVSTKGKTKRAKKREEDDDFVLVMN
jgi:hypothetical protein